jgi:arylsulfatase A-like enzyme
VRSNSLVESIDIYPTLASLAGLPPPDDVDGHDLSPLLKHPAQQISRPGQPGARQRPSRSPQ